MSTPPSPSRRKVAPLQKCVGALDRLDTEHESLLNDHGLPDVESAQGLRDPQAVLDIGLRLLVRPDGTERALARDLGAKQLVGPNHPKTLMLEFGNHGRQQTIVAERAIADAGKKLGRTPVRTEREE